MTESALLLLIVFQFKHLIADYYLQFPYMYENKGNEHHWMEPLIHHSLVHGVFTLFISASFLAYTGAEETSFNKSLFLGVVLFDMITHFITDRWKATRGRGPNESKFWTDLGIDQMIHHIVGIIIVYILVSQAQ